MRDLMRQRWTRSAVIACAAVGMVGTVGLAVRSCIRASKDCAWATRGSDDGQAVDVCSKEYGRTGDPLVGARLANSLRRAKQLPRAKQLANTLLATPAHAHAVQVLGKIASSEQQLELARGLLSLARVLHVLARDLPKLATDDQALGLIFLDQERFAEALRAQDRCIDEARAADAPIEAGYCHMSAAEVLMKVGYFQGAQQQLELASTALIRPRELRLMGATFTIASRELSRDLATLELKWGELEHRFGFGAQRLSRHHRAVFHFENAIRHATWAQRPVEARSAELNLAFSLAELGEVDEAARHLEIARQLDVDQIDDLERAQIEARIAYRRGDFARATSIHTRVYPALETNDERLRMSVLQAQIALDTGELEHAAAWATRGIEAAERVRDAAAIELRPWLMSLHREPYELLFTALARARRFTDALLAFDRWQGRTLFDAIARTKSTRSSDLREIALRTDEMRQLLPALSEAPRAPQTDGTAMLRSLERVELIALLVARDSVWRITAQPGRLDMVDLGPITALKPLIDSFVSHPTATPVADELGARLLGDGLVTASNRTLFVLLDGELTNLPVAALRTRGRWLAELRPIVRAARLSELDCVPALSMPVHATVLANARGDLPYAQYEATVTAARLGARPAFGPDATSKLLYGARREGVLHVAMHADVVYGAGELELFDQRVSGLEIATRSAGPRLVILSVCGSAASDDGELATSLEAGFLASGSLQVVATLRPVSDPGAAEITNAFYRHGGVSDPARALVRAQLDAAAHHNADWPNFALFGHDICRKASL